MYGGRFNPNQEHGGRLNLTNTMEADSTKTKAMAITKAMATIKAMEIG